MNLAKIRIVISSVVVCLFLLLFLGGEKLSVPLSSLLLPLQFVPALVHAFAKPELLFVGGLIFLVALSLVFGRIYCSFLCPLGALQDVFIAVSRKTGLRRNHSFRQPDNKLRYCVLIVTIVAAAAGIMTLVNLLDPFSLFGRTITHLFEPLSVWIYNAATGILKHFDIYLFEKKLHYIPISILGITSCFLLFIAVMSLRYDRLYCNTLCPVGTFFGLIARISVLKLVINKEHCSACGRCEKVCKAGCIETKKGRIDDSRCVNCFNCLAACPESVISYRPARNKAQQEEWSPARRGFVIGSVAAAGSLLFLFNSNVRAVLGFIRPKTMIPITPPGSVGLKHFTDTCTACHLCARVCPTKVITPSFGEYGFTGLMQPKMNYAESFCDYECNACGKVCPTGAIMPLALEEKKLTQIGEVNLLPDRCIVYVKNQNCGACLEVCPTHALYSTAKNNILYPATDARYCIGCGACQKACPTDPKSIIVQSKQIHNKAAKYAAKEAPLRQNKEGDKDFPF